MHHLEPARRALIAAVGALGLVLAAGAASAQGRALVIGNEDYRSMPDVAAADDVGAIVRGLEAAGFEVFEERNAERREMLAAAQDFVNGADNADRLVVLVLGRFVQAGGHTFMLPVNFDPDTALMYLGARTMDVSMLRQAMREKERGRAVLLLGTDDADTRSRPYISTGVGNLRDETAYVSVEGDVPRVLDLASRIAAGRAFDRDDLREFGLSANGLGTRTLDVVDGRVIEERGDVGGGGGDRDRAEREYWRAIRTFDTERAYVNYLDRYPQGAHAREASARLAELRDPSRLARAGEDDLSLGREDRRRVQAALEVLGFDPGGVDGLFGPGTRRAIQAWQASSGHDRSGYLTGPQLAGLIEAAALRGAELEEEAGRADRDYWRRTGRDGSEAGLRTYLDRYPQGLFAERARAALSEIEAERAGSAARADQRAFEEARALDRVPAYRRYVRENPNGAYVAQARARIRELRGRAGGAAVNQAAADGEAVLGLDPVTRGLIEGRLRAFGFDPGAVDGQFDHSARAAIRRYQESRGLQATGFLDEEAVARLLSDSLR